MTVRHRQRQPAKVRPVQSFLGLKSKCVRVKWIGNIEANGGLEYHFQLLVEAAELDEQLARHWTLVRCVDYWLWGLTLDFTEDPKRCDRITQWLMA